MMASGSSRRRVVKKPSRRPGRAILMTSKSMAVHVLQLQYYRGFTRLFQFSAFFRRMLLFSAVICVSRTSHHVINCYHRAAALA